VIDLGLPDWAERLLQAGIVAAVAVVVLALLRWAWPRLVARVPVTDDAIRQRQRRTGIRLVATALRYLVVVTAVTIILIVLAGGGGLAAIGGTALIVAVVGFGAQRLVMDVVAGLCIIFEGWYAVGDLVRVTPSETTGVVEEVGLRTTVLRTLNGDRLHIPNSQITSARRLDRTARDMALELLCRDADVVQRLVGDAAWLTPLDGATLLGPPRVTSRTPVGDDLVLVRVRVTVAPGMEWLVTDRMLPVLTARAGGALAAPPVVVELERDIVRRYQDALVTPPA
jgi:small conductance mechanosensitive channel